MKKILKKIMDIPSHFILVISVTCLALIISLAQGTITPSFAASVLAVGIFIVLQMYIGSIVIKTMVSAFAILYVTSMYTSAIIDIHDKVIEPFLFTLAAAAIFLAQTYSTKNVNFGLRSRPLWSFIMVFLTVSVKLTLILSGYGFLFSEMIGLYVLIILIVAWRMWTNKSKKTRVVSPNIIKREEREDLVLITIEEELDPKTIKWLNYKNENAYPFIFSEVMLAKENKKRLVLISTSTTSRIYDVLTVKINKSKGIKYLYINAKNDKYLEDAISNFKTEK